MAYDVEVADRLRALLSDRSGVTEKPMFGGLAFLVDGHMVVAAASRSGLLLRCDPTERDALSCDDRVEPFLMRGKEMKGWLYVRVDGSVGEGELTPWIDQALRFVATLPPK